MTHVVTCFLRHRGEVLLLHRSARVGSYPGLWGGVAGHVEGEPEDSAWREIEEETGLSEGLALAAVGDPFEVEDAALQKRWFVHPFLFDAPSREVTLDWESDAARWVPPPDILAMDVVPRLWDSYRAVAPTVEKIRDDREHGSAYLTLCALEVLRDAAGEATARGGGDVRRLAEKLVAVRPAMAALQNRIDRVMSSVESISDEGAIARAAHEEVQRAYADDEATVDRTTREVAGKCVLTVSRSGTVEKALVRAHPRPRVFAMRSEPGGEGTALARSLAQAGLEHLAAAGLAAAQLDLDHLVVADRLVDLGEHQRAADLRNRLVLFHQ